MHLPERQVLPPGESADIAPHAKLTVIVAEECHASTWSGLEKVQPEYDILYACSSVLSLGTGRGRWIAPAASGIFVPAGVAHTLELANAACVTLALIPRNHSGKADRTCKVIGISDLVRELLDAAAKLPLDGSEQGRDRLVLDLLPLEISRAARLPIGLPIPADPRLARKCIDFASTPHADMSVDRWAAELSMSRRRFASFFRREAGISFKAWVRQACFAIAMVQLAKGDSLRSAAASCGYASPSGLSALIKRLSGAATVRLALRTAR
jgi:AraC-like DNA-binding protein